MDVQQLRAFRSVVATGSVRAAADSLQYSPSAISQQITALQRDVGVALTRRVGRGVEPTGEGRALAERIDAFLGEMGDLDAFVKGLRAGRTTGTRLGYFSSLGATWLPRIVGPVADEFPETSIELFVADTFDPARRPRLDFQFLVVPRSFAPPEGYQLRWLADDTYVVAMRADHPLAAESAVPMAALAKEEWVDNDAAGGWCRQVTIDACAAAGFQPRYRIQTLDYPVALGLVAVGMGITVLPSLGARNLPEGVVSRPLVTPTPVRSIGALVADDCLQTPAVQRILELAERVGEESMSVPAPGEAAAG